MYTYTSWAHRHKDLHIGIWNENDRTGWKRFSLNQIVQINKNTFSNTQSFESENIATSDGLSKAQDGWTRLTGCCNKISGTLKLYIQYTKYILSVLEYTFINTFFSYQWWILKFLNGRGGGAVKDCMGLVLFGHKYGRIIC